MRVARPRQEEPLIGREQEIEQVRALMSGARARPALVVLHGPGGIGKSRLMTELAWQARLAGRQIRAVRADDVDGSRRPPALGLPFARTRPVTVLVDECERVDTIADWVAAALSEARDVVVLAATREPPPPRGDDSARGIDVVHLDLGPLSRRDSERLLAQLGTAGEATRDLAALGAGHPLALGLLAELHLSTGKVPRTLGDAPDLMQTLVHGVTESAPDAAHRSALEALALVHTTTETLLEALLPPASDTARLFDWLQQRSFVRRATAGLVPHDLAREAIVAELRWRAPERLEAMRHRAVPLYLARLRRGTVPEQMRAMRDLYFLFRDHHVMQSLARWNAISANSVSAVGADDAPLVRALIARHEGEAAARLAERWMAQQPQLAYVIRAPGRRVAGFTQYLRLDQVGDEDAAADPVLALARAGIMARGGAGELPVLINRFWLDADDYQKMSPVYTSCAHLMAWLQMTNPGLAFSLGVFADADLADHQLVFDIYGFVDYGAAEVGGKRFRVVGRDWRTQSPHDWLARFVERVTGVPAGDEPAPVIAPPPLRLDADQVRELLRVLHEPHRLGAAAAARLLVADGVGTTARERAAAVRARLEEAIASLERSRRGRRAMTAVRATYVEPLGTQEEVSEALDLPFSTYRRHLGEGLALLADYFNAAP